jgi:E3 ubiquitin-protein ligase makorin
MERPATSKARGACCYYLTPRGCFAGKNCKFLHGAEQQFTLYDQSKLCKFYAKGTNEQSALLKLPDEVLAGYCRRGDECWFRHTAPGSSASQQPNDLSDSSDADDVCNICLEKPTTYGLLGAFRPPRSPNNRLTYPPVGCGHVFCIKVSSFKIV